MINKERLIENFKVLAAFDSESYHEKEIANYLFQKLLSLGLETRMDSAGVELTNHEDAAGNIYGLLKGNDKGEPILFTAHMDTVAPGNGKKPVFHEDGKVTSDGKTILGADDMTGIVAILEMLEVIRERNLPHPDIEVIFFIAEEAYGIGSSEFDFSQVFSKYAYVLDLDGPIGRIANAAPSIIQFGIEVEGKDAHAGFEPEKGTSAILVAAKALNELTLGRIDDETTANVGVISGGTGKNIVPGSTWLEGEVRSLDHAKAIEVVRSIENCFQTVAQESGAKVHFTSIERLRAYQVDQNSVTVQRYAKALEEVDGSEPTIITTFGGSDNNNLCRNGIEGIVISNAMNQVHTTEEYFYMEDLVKSTEIVLRLATWFES